MKWTTSLLLLACGLWPAAATTINFTGPANGLWSNPANWTPIGVPNNGGGIHYDVFVHVAPVVVDGTFSVDYISSLAGTTVNLVLEINAANHAANPAAGQAFGNITVASGGTLRFVGDPGQAAQNLGTITLDPGSTLQLNGDFTHTGSIVGGTAPGFATLQIAGQFVNATGTIQTAGTDLSLTGGTFQNDGILSATAGSINLTGVTMVNYDSPTQTLSSGIYLVSGTGSLLLPGPVSRLVAANMSIADSGEILDNLGNPALAFLTELNSSYLTLQNLSAPLSFGDVLSTGGTSLALANSDVSFNSLYNEAASTVSIYNSTLSVNSLDNSGFIHLNGGTLRGGGVNQGTISASTVGVYSLSTIDIQDPGGLLNLGLISVNYTTLSVQENGGQLLNYDPLTQTLAGGSYAAGFGGTLILPGPVSTLVGANIELNGHEPGGIASRLLYNSAAPSDALTNLQTMQSSSLTLYGKPQLSTATGLTLVDSRISVAECSPGPFGGCGGLYVGGPLDIFTGGTGSQVTVSNGANLSSTAIFVDAGSSLSVPGGFVSTGTLDNFGETSVSDSGQIAVTGALSNSGTLRILNSSSPGTVTAASFHQLAGVVEIDPGSALNVPGTAIQVGTATQTGGAVTVNGTLSASGGYTVDGGSLCGTGQILSDVTVNAGGTLCVTPPPGNVGGQNLNILGNLAANGTISLVNDAFGIQTIDVSGTAQLGGLFEFINGLPLTSYMLGDMLTFLTYSSYTGMFASLNLPDLSALGLAFTPVYNATSFQLQVVNSVPEPATWLLAAAGALLAIRFRRKS